MSKELLITPVPTHELADTKLAKEAHRVLARNFPGFTWVVGLNDEDLGGVLTIMNLEVNEQLLGIPNWGYVLKLSRVYLDPSLKCVVEAGGAILESANLSRGQNRNEIITKIDGIDHSKFPLVSRA